MGKWFQLRDTRWQNYHLIYENNNPIYNLTKIEKATQKIKGYKINFKNVYCIFTIESYLKGNFDTLKNKRSSKKSAGLMPAIIWQPVLGQAAQRTHVLV